MFTHEHHASGSRGRSATRPAQPHRARSHGASPLVQRASSCACGGSCPRCQAKSNPSIGGSDGGTDRRGVPASVHSVLNASGQPLAPQTRAFFETRLGHDFSGVRVHADAAASSSARDVNALAYTVGGDVVFGGGQYAPETERGQRLLAHELAHVVQQGAGHAPPGDAAGISQPGDAAERRAEVAAAAVVDNRAVPDVGRANAATIHRLVATNGGEFDTTNYVAVNDATRANAAGVGKRVGADIALTFTPNSLVLADNIGLTQTVNTQRSTARGGPVTTPSTVGARNAALSLTAAEGDEGRAIDQGDPDPRGGDTIPNTSPLYTVENTPGSIATTLTDVPANFGTHAARTRNAAVGFDLRVGMLGDSPRRNITFAGQQYNQKFETTALVLDGPMAGTYLGSVEWGWQNDAAGNATLDPADLRLISAGAPTTTFFAAAGKFNAAEFTDPTTRTVHPTVDLPIIADDPASSLDDLHSGNTRAAGRTTANLVAFLNLIDYQLTTLAAGVARTNKLFEKQALEAELRTRHILATVRVVSTTSGPGDDDVYVKVTSGGRSFRTGVRVLGDGQTGAFIVPLATLVPLTDPLTVEVFEQDTDSADDLVVRTTWTPSGDPLTNTTSLEGADYRVTANLR